jgi:hypothetical protein
MSPDLWNRNVWPSLASDSSETLEQGRPGLTGLVHVVDTASVVVAVGARLDRDGILVPAVARVPALGAVAEADPVGLQATHRAGAEGRHLGGEDGRVLDEHVVAGLRVLTVGLVLARVVVVRDADDRAVLVQVLAIGGEQIDRRLAFGSMSGSSPIEPVSNSL